MNIAEFNKHLNIFGIGSSTIASEAVNGRMGIATLVSGVVTVANTSITANSRIFITPQSGTLNIGAVWVSTRVPGTSFTITSVNVLDTRVVAYQIFEPA